MFAGGFPTWSAGERLAAGVRSVPVCPMSRSAAVLPPRLWYLFSWYSTTGTPCATYKQFIKFNVMFMWKHLKVIPLNSVMDSGSVWVEDIVPGVKSSWWSGRRGWRLTRAAGSAATARSSGTNVPSAIAPTATLITSASAAATRYTLRPTYCAIFSCKHS